MAIRIARRCTESSFTFGVYLAYSTVVVKMKVPRASMEIMDHSVLFWNFERWCYSSGLGTK